MSTPPSTDPTSVESEAASPDAPPQGAAGCIGVAIVSFLVLAALLAATILFGDFKQ